MTHTKKRSIPSWSALALGLVFLTGCSGFGLDQVVERPDVRVTNARLVNTDLTAANLLVEFEVDNPNGVALVLDGVDYRLRVNGEPFLDGRRGERTRIAARERSTFELPLTLRYTDVLRVVDSFRGEGARRPRYQLDADFEFDVPVLGVVTVPVRETGDIPLERILDRFGLGL